jgi:hypothetical protein
MIPDIETNCEALPSFTAFLKVTGVDPMAVHAFELFIRRLKG